MAFSLQVQPQSGQNIGQGILMAAQGIAQGMNKYYQRKEENEQVAKAADMFANVASSNPFIAQAMGIQDPKDTAAIKNAIKGAGGPDKFMRLSQGVYEMGMQQRELAMRQAESERQAKILALQQAQDARAQVDADRREAVYQQGQAQVADMRLLNQQQQGGNSPLRLDRQAALQRRMATDPMLAQQAAVVASTGQPMDPDSAIRLRQGMAKTEANQLFKTQAEAQAALTAGGGRGSIQQGANGWSVRLDSGQEPSSERERLIKLTVGLEQKPNRTPEEELTLKYYKDSITKMNSVGSFFEQFIASQMANNAANKAP